jgi:guanylate kinase
MVRIKRRGLMLVLSSPSGAGKTTISRALLADTDDLTMSVSATTRRPRANEVDGVDYFFVDEVKFGLMINRQELFEHAKVFDHYYGTPKEPVVEALREGRDVLFDIDWQGTQQLSQRAREDLVRIFILPPSMKELRRRLESRASDSAAIVDGRMGKANNEISHWAEYDYIIINNDLETSLNKVKSILAAERLKRERQIGLVEFVKGLTDGH